MKNRKRFVRAVAVFLAALMLFSLVFSAMGSIFASAAGQSEIDKLEQEKESISEEKAEAAKAARNLREEKASYQEQKEALDKKLTLAQEEINITLEQIAIYEEIVAEKQAEADAAQEQADIQLGKYKSHLRAMEENGAFNSYLSVLFGANDFRDLLSRIDMITEIMEYEKALEQKYIDARDEALVVKAEYEVLVEEQEAKKAELEAESQQLQAEIDEAVAMIAEIEKEIKEYEKLYNAAVASEAAVAAKINQILKEIAAAEEAARREEEAKQEQENAGSGSENTGSENSGSTGSGSENTGSNSGSSSESGSAGESGNTGSSGSSSSGSTSSGSSSTNSSKISFTWPTPSCKIVTSPYGYRIHPILGTKKFHSGIDIGAASGSAIVASESGTVILVGSDSSGYGNYIVINHGSGYSTLYAHLSSIGVKKGATVTKGQTIGTVGMTGLSTGPHLHFEIRINGSTTDPLAYFSGYTVWD